MWERFPMENKTAPLENLCSFQGMKPAMMELPYPPIRAEEKNLSFANLLSVDYCGSVSELSAITQYINNENRLSCETCSVAKVILSIAMAEMMHLQKLGELIYLLGGDVDYVAKYCDRKKFLWTPAYLTIPRSAKEMLLADIESEKQAIGQYEMHIRMIQDGCVNAVLKRIIQDEEYHILLLQAMLKEL